MRLGLCLKKNSEGLIRTCTLATDFGLTFRNSEEVEHCFTSHQFLVSVCRYTSLTFIGRISMLQDSRISTLQTGILIQPLIFSNILRRPCLIHSDFLKEMDCMNNEAANFKVFLSSSVMLGFVRSVSQSIPTLYGLMDYRLPGSSVHRLLQATLEHVAKMSGFSLTQNSFPTINQGDSLECTSGNFSIKGIFINI